MENSVNNTETKKDIRSKKAKLYSKEQLLKSEAYKDKRDLLNAVLSDTEHYTKAQADKLISDYLKKEVK